MAIFCGGDLGDQRLNDLDAQGIARGLHRLLKLLLELRARFALDELAAALVGSVKRQKLRALGRMTLLMISSSIASPFLISLYDHVNFRGLFGLDAKFDDPIQAHPETVLRREAHVLRSSPRG